MIDWSPLILTIQLALATTLILLLISLPLAWWLSNYKSPLKPVLEAILSLPLVLPPTVLGFYFLLFFSPGNAFGSWLDEWLGIRLVFTFGGLVVASVLYSLPFMIHPIHSGITGLPVSLYEASYVLGKSKLTTFTRIVIPNIKASILTGIVLSFAHTVGEFGVVLMMGGSIPGKTKVASIAIYEEVEALNYSTANLYALSLLVIAFTTLLTVYIVNNRKAKRLWS